MSNGDAMRWGGNDDTGMMGTGDQMSGDGRQGRPHMTGFTNIDWRTSTDNKDVAKGHEFTGHMVTPDAKAPKCIQWCTGHNFSIWLMNNGEVYTSGYNGHYQLGYNEGGNTNSSNRSYTNRVSESDTVDWLGDTIRSFNDTKMVKVGTTSQGHNSNGKQIWALGEDGSVWIWGHNDQGLSLIHISEPTRPY